MKKKYTRFNYANINSEQLKNEINTIKIEYEALLTDKSLLDLCHLTTYVIDDNSTFENDDAISIQQINGNQRIWIHISDVSSLIRENSFFDNASFKRISSVYLPFGTLPMFPKKLADILSLKSKKKSITISAYADLDDQGSILHMGIKRTLIQPDYNLTYEEADELIDYAPVQEPDLFHLSELLTKRRNYRLTKGAIFLESPQGKFEKFDEIISIKIIDPSESRRLVGEAMILMGTIVAKFAKKNQLPLIFRCQNKSSHTVKDTEDINKDKSIPSLILKYKLKKAYYSTSSFKHFGLGLDSYVQATSPIRRYCDIVIQRQILKFISGHSYYSKFELDYLYQSINSKSRDISEIVNEEYARISFEWFVQNKDVIFEVFLIKFVSPNIDLVVLRFKLIERDIVCFLSDSNNINIGQCFKVKISLFDNKSSKLYFKETNNQ